VLYTDVLEAYLKFLSLSKKENLIIVKYYSRRGQPARYPVGIFRRKVLVSVAD